MVPIIQVAASAAVLAGSALGLDWSKGGDMCAGISSSCTGKKECTQTAYGPCKDGATTPDAYLISNFAGFAYVNSKKYLECTDPKKCEHMFVIDDPVETFRDFSKDVKVGTAAEDTRFAYIMTGGLYGDKDNGWPTYGYLGMSSSLVIGKGEISTKEVNVFSANPLNMTRVKRDDSDAGAPMGPYKVCISEVKGGVCNGADRKFGTGDYKFNIFGSGGGVKWESDIKAGKGPFPVGMDKMGVRIELAAVGFKPKALHVNGVAYNNLYKDYNVEFITILHAKGGVNIAFPRTYNSGKTINAEVDELIDVTETKNVEIRVLMIGEKVYIDYLFDVLEEGTYFMYDPDVTTVSAIPTAPPGTAGTPGGPSGPPGSPKIPGTGSRAVASAAVAVFVALATLTSM